MENSLSRKTIVATLTFFLVISVGYAIFSETITIEGTATTAQNDFNLTTTCTTGVPETLINQIHNDYVGDGPDFNENGYLNDNCAVNDNKVTMSVELEKPGSERWFIVNVKNTTTNDVVTEVDEMGAILFDNFSTNTKATNPSTGETIEINELDDDYPIIVPSIPGLLQLENGSYVVDYDEYIQKGVYYKDSSGKYYFKLAPNQSMVLGVKAFWYKNSKKQDYISETKMILPIEFKQLTSDMQVTPDIEPCMLGC